VTRPKARALEDVPISPRAITPEWLTAAMCSKTPGGAVNKIDVQLSSAGTHERHRLRVTYNEEGRKAGLPTSIFTKSMPTIVTRMVAGFNGHARVEGRFYSDVRPLLNIEAPICYYSAYDKSSFTGIHLLEDLVASKSATFCNSETDVTRSMAEDMVALLAALHGRFYGVISDNPNFRWLADYPTWFSIGAQKMRMEYHTARALDAAASLIPHNLMQRRREIWPATLRGLEIHRTQPNVFLHSDVHIGNWYRTGSGRMGLCDWQCPSRGHWARDFAYAVSAALTPENRRRWERELLALYLDRLAANGGETIDLDRAFNCYRQQLLHAFAMWTITLRHSPFLPSMQPKATTLEMLKRMAVAMDDLDALDSV
jgi:hypothetical protein